MKSLKKEIKTMETKSFSDELRKTFAALDRVIDPNRHCFDTCRNANKCERINSLIGTCSQCEFYLYKGLEKRYVELSNRRRGER